MVRGIRPLLLVYGVICLAFAPSAYGQTQQGSLSQQDKEFIIEAASGGKMEVEMGKMAAQKAANDSVKKFGQHMVNDHSAANDKLKALAGKKGVELAKAMNEKHTQMVDKMSNLSGKEFDCEYMSEMVKDHEKDVASFKTEAEKGKDADVKAFASDTVKVLERHLQMAKDTKQKVCDKKQ